MKILHVIACLILMVLVAFCAGYVALAAGPGSEDAWNSLTKLIDGERLMAFGFAVAVLCLVAIIILTCLPRRRREQFLSFENEGGALSISTIAITDFLAKLSTEFSAVVSMKPRVIPGKNEVDIVLDIKIRAGSEVHELCQLLQQRVRESMINGLGILSVRNVQVNVVKIASEHKFAWQQQEE